MFYLFDCGLEDEKTEGSIYSFEQYQALGEKICNRNSFYFCVCHDAD